MINFFILHLIEISIKSLFDLSKAAKLSPRYVKDDYLIIFTKSHKQTLSFLFSPSRTRADSYCLSSSTTIASLFQLSCWLLAPSTLPLLPLAPHLQQHLTQTGSLRLLPLFHACCPISTTGAAMCAAATTCCH